MGLFWAALLALQVKQPTVICLDPGHPSEVGRGTEGRYVTEMEVVWQVALRVRRELEQRGYQIVMTKRKVDEMVTNRARAGVANAARAALMVRLHCDANSGRGFAIYYAERAGRIGDKVGPSPAVLAATGPIARRFHAEFVRAMGGELTDNGLRGDDKTAVGAKYGALIGSIYSEVPTLLVELVNLKNTRDEDYVRRRRGQQRLAKAITDAVTVALPVSERR
jgi:N-acetylmuramoyl-L-alanine amidase